ncbi:ubiquitin carboxyl-terminal hydrolase 6-like [Lolium rigidum]|uniref:ubiquitin carboxyl-terminal hydrolase 6-like n=1 Tax=Lolium rigidum TaxID=89674 RepID=UPI001F5D40BA|nr:ubiquitin carboxyl-terminal hydrolase 6-like [Lolium rigidum]
MHYPDNVQGNAAGKASHDLTLATKSIFNELDHSDLPVLPVHFLETLRESVPQFKEKEGDTDIYRQQDAEECWSYLVNTLSETLSSEPSDPAAQPIKKLFEIEFLKRDCYEVNGDETTAFETTYNLGCPISDDVKDLREGIKLHLNSEVEKILDNGQPAHYKSKLAINKLPCYLVIKFGRICTEGGEQRKIKDEVPYPLELNVLEFCSDELKQKIRSCQQGLIGAENAGGTSLDGHVMSSTADMCTDGSSPTSLYDLVALVTHDGDTPNSGHYVAWVKQEGGYWTDYDDAFATEHKEEDVLNLCGGGDGPMAYMCLYKARMQCNDAAMPREREI